MLKLVSGFGRVEKENNITAESEVWEVFLAVKSNADCKKIKDKSLQHEETLTFLSANVVASGEEGGERSFEYLCSNLQFLGLLRLLTASQSHRSIDFCQTRIILIYHHKTLTNCGAPFWCSGASSTVMSPGDA